MDVAARLTSKGQVTIPRSVREALGLRDGDAVI
ncbi:MAG TPA: AbrB/MazE/SpoVT family DNA-binding domain-containing protein, partial [Mycobacterium sp.]